jgi:lysophospholipase L1-like esterase
VKALLRLLLLAVAGLLAGLLLIELGLRLINPNPTYFPHQPNSLWEFNIDTERLPGLDPHSVYSTNAIGARGDAYQADGRYNILAIGGSTTESTLIEDSKTWAYLLQTSLNREGSPLPGLDPETPVWVGNIGSSGRGLVENIHALKFFVPQYRFDAIILLAGVNDFHPILQQPMLYDDHYEDPNNYAYYLHRSFFARPLLDPKMARPFPKNTAVWNLVDVVRWNLSSRQSNQLAVEVPDTTIYQIRQENYSIAPLIPMLPDLTLALIQYRDNLHQFIAIAKAQDIRLILATQPAIWHENISTTMEKTLWYGFRGKLVAPTGRYDPVDLRDGLDQFNQILLEICQEEAVECVDLAADMTGQEQYYYDDIHFNVAGSAQVANLLAAHFLQHPIE